MRLNTIVSIGCAVAWIGVVAFFAAGCAFNPTVNLGYNKDISSEYHTSTDTALGTNGTVSAKGANPQSSAGTGRVVNCHYTFVESCTNREPVDDPRQLPGMSAR